MNSRSRLQHQISALFVVVLTGLVGCTKPDKGDSANNTDFYVTKFSSRSRVKSAINNSGWSVPYLANYTFTACVTDRATASTIRGHRFEVKNEKQQSMEVLASTDANGCFTWVEDFAFDYFAQKTPYVSVERTITGSGVYKGERKILFAINPWTVGEQARQKGDAAVLLNDGQKTINQIPEEQLASPQEANLALSGDRGRAEVMANPKLSSSRIWVDSVSLRTVKRRSLNDGYTLDGVLTLRPILKLIDSDGNSIPKPLNSGAFDIVAHLVVTDTGPNENEKMILTEVSGIPGSGRVDLGQLRVMIRTGIIKRAHNGNVTLVLKLIPKGVSGNIAPFEGLFELGGLQALNSNPTAPLLPSCHHPSEMKDDEGRFNTSDRPCQDVASFLKDAGGDKFEKLKAQGFASDEETYVYGLLSLRFISVLAGETATQRTVLYSASTCITERYDGARVAKTPFRIEYLDDNDQVIDRDMFQRDGPPTKAEGKTSLIKATDSFGCLKWNAKISHKYYNPEQFFWQKVRITRMIEGKKVEKKISFALNPWDDKFTFGWDKIEFIPFESKKAKSRFFLSSFGYHTVRFLYNIDPFMELEVKKTVLLDLQPRVLRYSGIISARKMTEQVRDGIYLLKVAIQKDFLDPTERSIDIKTGSQKNKALNNAVVPAVIMESLGKVTPREYITTDTSLVRVVDGHLIHPIELTMRDLRLMRVRSNFLIQLETVDERLVQSHDVMNGLMRKDMENLISDRQVKELERQEYAPVEGMDADEQAKIDEKNIEEIKAKAEQKRAQYKAAFFSLKQSFESMPFGVYDGITQVDPKILEPIYNVLKINDFTDVKLARKDQADLNLFVEKNSGLDVRSFVGPVIFLSNAYSDSVRATDNLDEAECESIAKMGQKKFIEFDDQDLFNFGKGESFLADTVSATGSVVDVENGETVLRGTERQNKAYRFSRYYGALTHFCPEEGPEGLELNAVDKLIAREKIYEQNYRDVMPVASSKANFVRSNSLDYASLVSEPLETLQPDQCDQMANCQSLRTRVLGLNDLDRMVSAGLNRVNAFVGHQNGEGVSSLNVSHRDQILLPPLDLHNLRIGSSPSPETDLSYKRELGIDEGVMACSILADLLVDRMELIGNDSRASAKASKLRTAYYKNKARGARAIFNQCALRQSARRDAVVGDEKLKVYDTGADYVFRGGLQLNFNVGKSVSFGRSDSWGASIGLEDVPAAVSNGVVAAGAGIGFVTGGPVGAVAGAGVGFLIGRGSDFVMRMFKPISIKKSTGTSNSEGTNVSQGTYLVSQMAKFDVPIVSYERCRIIRFSQDFALDLADQVGLSDYVGLVSKGLMICGSRIDAQNESQVVRVPETYFYFTQHFTEGDMLDQADLYNHPWLLAMRGLRDFGTFVQQIEALEVANISGFWNGLFEPEKNPWAWPLDHMANTYRNLTPSFPGFYTLGTTDEMITNFPLNGRLTRYETDINAEVQCSMEKSNSGLPVCAEKITK